MTIRHNIRTIKGALEPLYGEREAESIARMVVCVRLDYNLSQLVAHYDDEVEIADLDNIIAELSNGRPVQYVLGKAEFCELEFEVAEGVLIPRPETEELVELVAGVATKGMRILDVGTGTGTIALMAAQRLSDLICRPQPIEGDVSRPEGVSITAIDIDEASATEATENFRNSPWADMLSAQNITLDAYSATLAPEIRFDHIFSNPPYFDDALQAPEQRRNDSRHTSTGLSYRELLEFAKERLTEDGRISLVLPAETEAALTRHARMCGLHLFRILRVRTVPRKHPIRIIAEFSFQRCQSPSDETLIIQSEGRYTDEYLALTRDFYLFA